MFQIRRFWAKVDRNGPIHPILGTNCWIWLGSTNFNGYGHTFFAGRTMLVHRVSWLLEYGKLPENFACHHCDVPPCVRPDHLFDGTHEENMLDRVDKAGGRSTFEQLYTLTENGWVRNLLVNRAM